MHEASLKSLPLILRFLLQIRMKMECERQALTAFVRKFDSIGISKPLPLPTTKLNPPLPTPGGAAVVFAERQRNRLSAVSAELSMTPLAEVDSPMRVSMPITSEPSLLEEHWDAIDEISFEETGRPSKSPLGRAVELPSVMEKENISL